MTLHSKGFRFVSALCCGTLIALPLQDGYISSAAPDAATTLANSLRALQDGENTAPRDHWDPTYVEAQLGHDPARTFAWVRDHTYWIPYHGILRGPVGVLMDRQGDSLDRALLLATMLKDEGQTVRLARGSMARNRAEMLMPALMSARTIRDATRQPSSSATNDVDQVATKYKLDPASVQKTVNAQASNHARQQRTLDSRFTGQVQHLLDAAGPAPQNDKRAAADKAVSALVDHWWVEVQANGSWQPRDLLTSAGGAPLAVADRTLDLAALPADLYHQVTVRVIAEQWSGGTTSEKAALEQTIRPMDVIGAPVSLVFTPGESMKGFPAPGLSPAASLRANVMAQREWTPSLYVGKQHVVQNAITDGGTLTVPSNDSDVLAVAKGATHGLAGAIDDVFGSSPSKPAPSASNPRVLSAVWIEYAIVVPGEATRVIRRQVFDLPGPAARAAKSGSWRLDDAGKLTRGLALMMSTEILPVGSELSPQYVAHLSRQAVLQNASLAADVVTGRIPNDFGGAQAVAGRLVPNVGSLYGLALQRLNRSPVAALVYVDRPQILSRHVLISQSGATFKPVGATDIVANSVGIDPIGPSPFKVAVAQGVYDTNGEAVLYSDKPDAANTGWAYERPSSWVTLMKPGDPALASLQLGADVRQRIDTALSSNHIVVAPRARVPVGGGAFAGWWQIDKVSGETLGMGESGWGQDLPEYAVLLMVGSLFVNNWLACELQPDPNAGAVVASAEFGGPRGGNSTDLFAPAVDASSVSCLVQAFVATLLGIAQAGGYGLFGGENSGGSLPDDAVDPMADTVPEGLPGDSAGAGNPGGGGSGKPAGAGNPAGGGAGGAAGGTGGGDVPPGGGNPGGGKYTRQQLMDYYIDTRGRLETQAGTGNEGQWQKEFIMRQPGVKDFVRDDLAKDLGYPTGEGNQPDPQGFEQWLNRYLGGGAGGSGGGQTIFGDPAVNAGAPTQRIPSTGTAGTGAGGDDIPPTLRSPGVGSSNGQSGGQGGSGSTRGSTGGSSPGSGGGSGTLPGLDPSTPRTPTSPGLGPCTPNCGPSGSTTLVGLGGAMNALGGS